MLAAICVAAGNVYGYTTALAIFIGSLLLLIALVLITTLTISVTNKDFIVGRARLPLEFVGQISVLDKSQTQKASSNFAHPDAYFAIRSWIPTSLIVVVTDESDPHPYWHVSSRKSMQLKNALELTQRK